jgi:heme exporter protein A
MASENSSAEAVVRVEHVAQRYGRKPVLKDVSLQVNGGEVAALLGANGAGKTTLLRILAGLDNPERGQVWLGNVHLANAGHEIRRYVGLVSHRPLVYDNLNGLENLRFFARMYDIIEPEPRIESVLTAMDLWRRRYDPVRTYSRGMIQRLAIGRAILHDPPVLLLDEPDTGLDQESVAVLTDLIAQLRSGGRAVLVTTHSWDRAERWADRIYHLADGTIRQADAIIEKGQEALRQR